MYHCTFTLHDQATHLPSFFRYSHNMWWQVEFMMPHIMQISPISYYYQP